MAGLEADRPGVVWLDAYPDFNTPETSGSGLLDVLDASEAPANAYATSGGLSREELTEVLAAIRERSGIDAFTLASYDREEDPDGAACEAALDAVETAAGRS